MKDLQAFAGLTPSGELDEATLELMRTPRCGVRDIIGHGATARRRRRYVLQGSRWRVNSLTYRVTEYPAGGGLTNQEVDDTIKKSFDLWSAVTDLSFSSQESGSVHIEIRFASYEHGDGDPFDGPGGTLAHAYFPAYGGDMHIDDSELWTINNFRVRVPGSGLELCNILPPGNQPAPDRHSRARPQPGSLSQRRQLRCDGSLLQRLAAKLQTRPRRH